MFQDLLMHILKSVSYLKINLYLFVSTKVLYLALNLLLSEFVPLQPCKGARKRGALLTQEGLLIFLHISFPSLYCHLYQNLRGFIDRI